MPASESLRLSVLSRHHDAALAGHQGIKRTRSKIVDKYFWSNMEKDIRQNVRTCMTCQRNSERNSSLPGLLHPLEVPTDRFKEISIDFTKLTTSTTGHDSLMVVVDRLTKLVKLIPNKSTDTAPDIAHRLIKG